MYCPQLAAKRQLAAHRARFEPFRWQLAARGEQSHGQREVEAWPGLTHVRGREIGRQSLERKLEPGVEHRGAHALPRLPHGGIGKPHDCEHGQARPDVDLDRDLPAVNALEGEGGDVCKHTANLRCLA